MQCSSSSQHDNLRPGPDEINHAGSGGRSSFVEADGCWPNLCAREGASAPSRYRVVKGRNAWMKAGGMENDGLLCGMTKTGKPKPEFPRPIREADTEFEEAFLCQAPGKEQTQNPHPSTDRDAEYATCKSERGWASTLR